MAPASSRRYEGRMIGNSFRVSIRVVSAACMLTACAQSNSSADLSAAAPPPEPQVIEAEPPPPPAPPGRTKSAAAPASRAKQAAPAAPSPPATVQAALTPEEAKGKCWMRYENDKRAKNIDDRLKLVEKCVDDTMRGKPPQ
jgi:type IV secretory pathway VirB10-like protein